MKKILLTILTLITLSTASEFVFAANDRLPETMVGQTKAQVLNSDKSMSFSDGKYVRVNGLTGPTGDMAVSFMVNLTSATSDYNTAIRHSRLMGYNNTNPTAGWAIGFQKNQVKISVGNGTSAKTTVASVSNINVGEWTKITVTRTGNKFDIYKDSTWIGGINTAFSGSIFYAGPPSQPIIIGDNDPSASVTSELKIDQVKIYNSAIQSEGNLLGSWDFDGIIGTSVPDTSGNNHPGLIVGAETSLGVTASDSTTYYGGFNGNQAVYNYTNDTTDPSGGPGQMMGKALAPSLSFTSANNSYLNCGTAPYIAGEGAFAISVWVKRNRPSDTIPVDPFGTDGSNTNPKDYIIAHGVGMSEEYSLYFNSDGQLSFREYGNGSDHTGGAGPDLKSGPTNVVPANDNKWRHIVVMRDANGTDRHMWIDGVNVANITGAKVNIANSSTSPTDRADNRHYTTIGRHSWEFSYNNRPYPFQGKIDEVKIFNGRSLQSSEIGRLFAGKSTIDDNVGLTAHWKFDEGSGDTVYDSATELANHTCTLAAWTWTPPTASAPLTAAEKSIWNNKANWLAINPHPVPLLSSQYAQWELNDGAQPVDLSMYDNGGYDLFGFDNTSLTDCITGALLGGTYHCFVSNSTNRNVKVMSSRTYVNSGNNQTAVMEMASLYYPPKSMIAGDAYLGNMDPNNFSYWGRNLVQSSTGDSGAGSFWGVNDYAINPEAQASFSGVEYGKYKEKIIELTGEASTATDLSPSPWYLQTSHSSIGTNGINNSYPQGKIWKYPQNPGNLTISSSKQFSGKGTIIVRGNLTIDAGVNIEPADADSILGLIVLGNVTIGGNNTINASIFAAKNDLTGGNISFSGNNVDLIGSFVAKNFTNIDSASNIRFYYDKKLNASWPPGFGYLDMPQPKEN